MSNQNEQLDKEEIISEKIVVSQGLDAEQYDVARPFVESEKISDEDNLGGIDIKYDLKSDEVKKALKVFQKKTIYKKNLIYTAILIVFFVLYLDMLFKDPSRNMAKIIAPLCVIIIAYIWYLPFKHIKNTAKAVDLNNDIFTIKICEEGLLLDEQKGQYLISYNKPTTKCIELNDVFVIFISDKQIFAVPKRCIDEDKIESVKTLLKDGLKEKYEIINK